MNSFSFNRFIKTLRWVLSVDLNSLLIWLVGISVGTFLGELLFMAMNAGKFVPMFFTVFIMITYCVMLSLLFYDLNKKPRREAFLMLPATHLEKYLSALFYVTFVWGIGILLAFVAGDALRMAFRSLVFGDEWISAAPEVMRNLMPNGLPYDTQINSWTYRVLHFLVISGFAFWLHSLYVLGGTLLRKYAFVVSSVVMILCMMLLSWVIRHFQLEMFMTVWDGDTYVMENIGTLAYVLAVVLPLLSVFNYWASFHIFKGFQLITNKWTNYDILKR